MSAIPIHEKFRKDPADRDVSFLGITTKGCTHDGMLMDNSGRYVQLYIHFVGSPFRSATIWGKRVSGEADSEAVQFSREEIYSLGL